MAHKDLEFAVSIAGKLESKHFRSFDKACGHAVSLAASRGEDVVVDVLTWSRSAAAAWGGDEAAEVYDEDPEASVHERIVVRADAKGRVA